MSSILVSGPAEPAAAAVVAGGRRSHRTRALALSGLRWLGAITPLGGVCFLAGWLCLGLAARG